MKCPYCRTTTTDVYNSRTTKFGTQIWRRRRCGQCHEAFTTYEAADLSFLKILPATPSRASANHTVSTKRAAITSRAAAKATKAQPYSRTRLFASLSAAFVDNADQSATIDALTDTIEAKILDLRQREISSGDIARIVLSTLKHFDTAAFVRYLTAHTPVASSAQLKKELGRY